MLRLMLLRHAKADSPEGVADHERPLAGRGIRQSEIMGRYMASHSLRPDLARVSTSRRTQDTWALIKSAFASAPPHLDERRIYDATTDDLLDVIHDTDPAVRTLVLVGHNPGFEQLANMLSGTGQAPALTRLAREYPTAGLAVIDFTVSEWRDVAAGGGHLERFETLATISN